jgi:cytolysin-activating lysine-acyltransferase
MNEVVSNGAAIETSPPKLNSAILGEVTWLMTQSDLHKGWPISSVIQWVVPALLYNQYRLYRNGDKPVGYVSWGRFSAEVETGYVRDPSSLQPKDWQSGERLWILDWIAPQQGTYEIAKDLKNNVFPDQVARALRWKRKSDTMNIFYLHGKNAVALARDHDSNPTVKLELN